MCGRLHVQNNNVLYLSISVKHKDLTRKSCVFVYFIDSVVKIVLSDVATEDVLYKKVLLKFTKFTGKYKYQTASFSINLQAL